MKGMRQAGTRKPFRRLVQNAVRTRPPIKIQTLGGNAMAIAQTAKSAGSTRRRFILAAGAATVAAPAVVKAQGVINMRWQSTWPSKDIFHEFALDFAKKVNDMTGGDLKIEVLP